MSMENRAKLLVTTTAAMVAVGGLCCNPDGSAEAGNVFIQLMSREAEDAGQQQFDEMVVAMPQTYDQEKLIEKMKTVSTAEVLLGGENAITDRISLDELLFVLEVCGTPKPGYSVWDGKVLAWVLLCYEGACDSERVRMSNLVGKVPRDEVIEFLQRTKHRGVNHLLGIAAVKYQWHTLTDDLAWLTALTLTKEYDLEGYDTQTKCFVLGAVNAAILKISDTPQRIALDDTLEGNTFMHWVKRFCWQARQEHVNYLREIAAIGAARGVEPFICIHSSKVLFERLAKHVKRNSEEDQQTVPALQCLENFKISDKNTMTATAGRPHGTSASSVTSHASNKMPYSSLAGPIESFSSFHRQQPLPGPQVLTTVQTPPGSAGGPPRSLPPTNTSSQSSTNTLAPTGHQ